MLAAAAAAAASTSTTTQSADPTAIAAYTAALRRELGVSLENANVTVSDDGLLRSVPGLAAGALALSLPPKYVVTVKEALGSTIAGLFVDAATHKIDGGRRLPRTLPRHFVLAMWVLSEKHLAPARANGLWRRWLDALPPLDNNTLFWRADELEALEEERAMAKAAARRRKAEKEYDELVRVLLVEGGLEDDLPADVLTFEEYCWALTVVTAHSLHFARDFPVLAPLRLRFHPAGSSVVVEWGSDEDPGAALYVTSGGVAPGAELTVISDERSNEDLLLHGYYIWDEMAAARPTLHLGRGDATRAALAAGPRRGSGDDDDDDDDGYGGAAAAVDDAPEARARLLRARNWTSSMTIELGDDDALPAEALSWLRLILAPAATIEPERRCAEEAGGRKKAASCVARVHELFDGPTSVALEGRVVTALRNALSEALAKYDHSVEEDEEILAAPSRRQSLPPRAAIAATFRKRCKQVLMRNQALVDAHWAAAQRAIAAPKPKAAKKAKPRRKGKG